MQMEYANHKIYFPTHSFEERIPISIPIPIPIQVIVPMFICFLITDSEMFAKIS